MPRLRGVNAVRQLYGYKGIYYEPYFESLDGFNVVMTAGGSAALDGGRVTLMTGGIPDDYICLRKQPSTSHLPVTATWDKPRRMKTALELMNVDYVEAYYVSGLMTPIAPHARHIGFKVVNNQIFGSIGDGAVETLTPALKTIAAGVATRGEAVYIPTKRVDFYIEGAYAATLTSGLPSGTVGANTLLVVQVQTKIDTAKVCYCVTARVLQEA